MNQFLMHWLSIACEPLYVLGVLLTAPLLMELLVLSAAALLPVRRRRACLPAINRLITVVPAHNEERHIEACITSMLVAGTLAEDIIVVAHNSADRTFALAKGLGVNVQPLTDDEGGKGNALKRGFAVAFGELNADAVMIVDADSTLSPGLPAKVRDGLQTALAVQCRYEFRTATPGIAQLRSLALLCMNTLRPFGRSNLGLSCGILGNGFALRREALERVPYRAFSIVEDVEYHICLVRKGIKVAYVGSATVYSEVPPDFDGALTQSARWEGGRLQLARQMVPRLIGDVLRGRLTSVEPLLDLLSLPLAHEVTLLILLLLLPLHGSHVYATGGFCILVFHLLVGISRGEKPWRNISALFYVPVYIWHKLAMLAATLRTSRVGARWVRTPRLPKSGA
jgi:cellulose synthase/poly-beta-1,6-N-acetylglucosamine synthase-like glycosyltransferase